MSSRKVAVVTGGNKGIGYAIVEGLCKKFNGDVYLTSRDVPRGQAAVDSLKSLGFNPLFHQLDVTDQKSVDKFRDYLATKYGGLDVLVNNAAVVYETASKEPASVKAKETIRTNYYGTLWLCNALFPLLRQNARVVNVSSSAGHLSHIKADDLKAKFNDKNITVDELNKLMDTYVRDAAEGKEDRWAGPPYPPYIVSKVGLSCLTQIQQKLFDAEKPNRNIYVNSCHPGFIETDLTSEMRAKVPGAGSIEEGATAPLFLALETTLKGKYVWKDCKVIDWDAPSLAQPW
jgi:carbonyl reductase 1